MCVFKQIIALKDQLRFAFSVQLPCRTFHKQPGPSTPSTHQGQRAKHHTISKITTSNFMNQPFSIGDSFTIEGVSERVYTLKNTKEIYSVHFNNLTTSRAESIRSSLHRFNRREGIANSQEKYNKYLALNSAPTSGSSM